MKSIVRDDHRREQPANFKLKRKGFLFATILVVFIALEGNGSRAVPIHNLLGLSFISYVLKLSPGSGFWSNTRSTLIFVFVFIFFHGAVNFTSR